MELVLGESCKVVSAAGLYCTFTLITKSRPQGSCSIFGFLRAGVQDTHLLPLLWHFSFMDLNSQWTFTISCTSFSKHVMPKIDASKVLPSGLQHDDGIPMFELNVSFRNPLQVWVISLIMDYFNHNDITDYDTNLPPEYI